MAALKKPEEVKKLSKSITEGQSCEMVCHLLESDNNLGRSLVIDLNAHHGCNYRQVDHRSIEYIIYKNVKYSLGRKAPGTDELPLKVDRSVPKWDQAKLATDNWFSQI